LADGEISLPSFCHLPMRETAFCAPHKFIGVAVIWNDQRQIFDQPSPGRYIRGLWEFPGGKIEPGETIRIVLNEIWEEIGIAIEVGEHLITIDYTYTHLRVTLTVHHCRHLTGIPQPLECDEIRWVTLDEIDQFTFRRPMSKLSTCCDKCLVSVQYVPRLRTNK